MEEDLPLNFLETSWEEVDLVSSVFCGSYESVPEQKTEEWQKPIRI